MNDLRGNSMDHKPWLWRKKSTEKAIVSSDQVSSAPTRYEEQMEAYSNGRAEKEKELKDIHDNVDDLIKKHEKTAQDAIAARDKEESELVSLRKKLDECLKQRAADEERLAHLGSVLDEYTKQLRFVREDQEQRIHDAVMKVSVEFEESRLILEGRLEETTKRLAKIVLENNQLTKSIMLKERSIEDLSKQRAQAESEFGALMSRLYLIERDSASLKYEVRVLEKELELRSEEREVYRRSAELSHKQHLESVKKAARLESECQKLRLLVRKQLPGPASAAKMRNDAAGAALASRDPSGKRIEALTEQLTAMEEENKALREALERKSSVKTASCAESWASALISELENFRNEKLKESPMSRKTGASEISLMDDFVEMEKMAFVSTDDEPYKGCPSNFLGLGDSRDTMNESISKVIELLEGITLPSAQNNYTARVFQWKTSELGNVIQEFLHTCYGLLSGKTDFCKFGRDLAFALEWILNHCFSLQDVSSMREEHVKSFDWDDSRSDNEAGSTEQGRTVETLRREMERLRESKKMIEDQMESQRSINEDLNKQLSVARTELNEARERLFSLEAELESKSGCCAELENTCLDLQLQVESVMQSKAPKDEITIEDEPLRTDSEIAAASEKLAECQETILNLGKQLKALAAPEEVALFDRVIPVTATNPTSPKRSTSHRPSLLDQMLADDKAKANDAKTKVTYAKPEFASNEKIAPPEMLQGSNGTGGRDGEGRKTEALAIVPVKKPGVGGLWKKLLWKKKRVSSKKQHAL